MFHLKKTSLTCLLLCGTLLLSSTGAWALHPDLQLPEKVELKHKACQEVMRIGTKYKVEGLFSKDFEEGKVSCTRMDVAAAVLLLSEKLAERVVKEGPEAVERADLVTLADLKEELRAEMLVANTRTFQARNEELGTHFTALTKNISLSGGLVGVVQGSIGNKSAADGKDHADAVGRGDIVFNFKVGDNTIAVIDVEATGGDGIDAHIPTFSGLNGVAGSTGDRVRFREAWVEHTAFNDHLTLTAGKIDLTNYFDANAVANDENSQFLTTAFVNSAVLSAPDIGPGVRALAKLAEPLTLGIGYGSGNAETSDLIDHGFGIAELAYKHKFGELEGNYRIYGTLDGSRPLFDEVTGGPLTAKTLQRNAFGFGVSLDQQVTDKLTLFARYGQRDKNAYTTRSAWSVGGQITAPCPHRKDDVLGFAYGQVLAAASIADSQEKLAEVYYRFQVNKQINVAPIVQYAINPSGTSSARNFTAVALRTQIVF